MKRPKTFESVSNDYINTLKKRDYSGRSLQNANYYITRIRKHIETSQSRNKQVKEALEDFIAYCETEGKNEDGYDRVILVVAKRLYDLCTDNEINWHRSTERTTKKLTIYYEEIMQKIVGKMVFPEETIKNVRSCCRLFFDWLAKNGVESLDKLTPQKIQEFYTFRSKTLHFQSIKSVRAHLKRILSALYREGYTEKNYSFALVMPCRTRSRILPAADPNVISALLDSIGDCTPIAKRDYAIVLLATQTGLRCVDIADLKLSAVNWREGKIHIVQKKTGHEEDCVLTKDIMNALIDYKLKGRPSNPDTDKYFLSARPPHNPLSSEYIRAIYRKRLDKLESDTGIIIKAKGFHAIRRMFAMNLIKSGTEIITVKNLVGHTNICSTDHYLNFDTKNLRECALPLALTYKLSPRRKNS